MTTNTTEAAGTSAPVQKTESDNVTTANLAAMLTRKSSPQPKEEETDETPAGAGEQPDGDNPDTSTDDSNPNPDVQTDEAGDEGNDDGETEGDEATEDTETEGGEGEKPELPAELSAALNDAKLGKGVKDILRRVHKLADARDTERNARLSAEERVRTMEAEWGELKANGPKGAPVVLGSDPVTSHPEIRQLDEALSGVNAVIEWAEANPDGGTVDDGKGGTMELSAAQARKLLRDAERQRTDLAADKRVLTGQLRQQHAQAEAHFTQVATQAYPWMGNEKSPEYLAAAKAVQMFPELKRTPSWKLMIADWHAGRQAREAREKQPAAGSVQPRKPKAPKEPTPQGGRPGAAAPRQDPVEKQERAAEEEFEKTGSAKALGQVFATKRRGR